MMLKCRYNFIHYIKAKHEKKKKKNWNIRYSCTGTWSFPVKITSRSNGVISRYAQVEVATTTKLAAIQGLVAYLQVSTNT